MSLKEDGRIYFVPKKYFSERRFKQLVAYGYVGIESYRKKLKVALDRNQISQESYGFNMDMITFTHDLTLSVLTQGLIATSNHVVFEVGIARFNVPDDLKAQLAESGIINESFSTLKAEHDLNELFRTLNTDLASMIPSNRLILVPENYMDDMEIRETRGGSFHIIDKKSKSLEPVDRLKVLIGTSVKLQYEEMKMKYADPSVLQTKLVSPEDLFTQTVGDMVLSEKYE